ncbi:hypothetical protein COCCU_07805 [Corynebacterium occultum]|uniref:Uncharacterized protein n=1 Tax=Corynebacterium occultum TaxID=2675219 RepID=A0A6B8W1U9_9CORY|nr:hypothetical protein [Corynebacterium occultum]QGU07494.1 hypothetical protein COCCU_07805 [Corynebacterium occultum]
MRIPGGDELSSIVSLVADIPAIRPLSWPGAMLSGGAERCLSTLRPLPHRCREAVRIGAVQYPQLLEYKVPGAARQSMPPITAYIEK